MLFPQYMEVAFYERRDLLTFVSQLPAGPVARVACRPHRHRLDLTCTVARPAQTIERNVNRIGNTFNLNGDATHHAPADLEVEVAFRGSSCNRDSR
jgi:hypothetical protein